MYDLIDDTILTKLNSQSVEYVKHMLLIVMCGPALFHGFSLKQLFLFHT